MTAATAMKARKYCPIRPAALRSKPWSMSWRPAAGRTKVAAEEIMRAIPAIAIRPRKGFRKGKSSRNGLRDLAFFRPDATRATSFAYSSPDCDIARILVPADLYKTGKPGAKGGLPGLVRSGPIPYKARLQKPHVGPSP